MALKMPIIEIPISDAAFQKFASTFASFQEQLEKNPGRWRKVNEAILGQGAALRQLGTAGQPAEKLWKNVAGWSGSVLSNTVRISGELLKWGTILGGGLLGGSLFGITKMAGDVANYRRTAMGLGMSIGGMRSFDINMARLGNPGSFLEATNQALMNPALQSPLYALGVNPTGGTEQTSIAMLKAMRRLALATPRGLLGSASDAYGLGPWGGATKLQILKYMKDSEFARMILDEGRDRSKANIPDPIAKKWTDFTKQMDLAGNTIFKTFVLGLAPLEKPLEHLSAAFADFLSRLMSGPYAKEGIERLAHFFETFNGTLASPRFLHSLKDIASDVEKLASVLGKFFGNPTNPGASAHVGGIGDWWRRQKEYIQTGFDPTAFNAGYGNKGDLKQWLSFLDKQNHLPVGTMEAVAKTESGFNANAYNAKTGAAGMFQYTPGTAAAQGVTDPYDVVQEGRAAAQYLSQLQARYGSMAAAHAVYGGYGNEMRALMSKYGKNWQAHMPRPMRNYVVATTPDSSIVVTAQHKTGGSAVLAGAGLAAVPGT